MMQNQERELQQLNQLVDLLGKIQNLSSQSANLLDPFQQSVIDSLKKVKQEEVQKKMINQFDLSTLVYNMKIEAKIVNKLIFASFALNLPFDKLQDGPFNQLSLQQKLDYVEMNLFQTEDTKIQIQDKFITSKQAKQVVMQLLKEMIQESKTKPFLPLCYSLVKKFQNQINDLCVVALVRSIIYNAKENDTPPYSQLLNIFSELDSYPPVQDEKEFWWKVCNAFACYVYLGQENKAPQKLGYPAIPDHQLLLPDILLIKENNQLKYLINENFKPVYMNKNRNRNR